MRIPDPPPATQVSVNVARATIRGGETTHDILVTREHLAKTVADRFAEVQARKRACEPEDFDAPVSDAKRRLEEFQSRRPSRLARVRRGMVDLLLRLGACLVGYIGVSLCFLIAFGIAGAWFGAPVSRETSEKVLWWVFALTCVAAVASVLDWIGDNARVRKASSRIQADLQTGLQNAKAAARTARTSWAGIADSRADEFRRATEAYEAAADELRRLERTLARRHIDPHPVTVKLGLLDRDD